MPMSTVPPSPAWPIDAHVAAALHLQGGGDPGRDRRRVREQRVHPRHLPRGLRVGRREDLQAAGRVGRDQAAVGCAHRGVERVARSEHLAAALARAVALGDRVAAVGVGLHRALLGVEQAVAGRVAAHLVELDRRRGHDQIGPAATTPTSRSMFSACGPERRDPARCARARARRARGRGRGRSTARGRPRRPCSSSSRSDPAVIGRPPSPAMTVWTCALLPASATWTSCETIPPTPSANAFSMTTTRAGAAEHRRAPRCSGNGRNALIAERSDPDALLAQRVDRVLDRPEHRSERDHDRLGVLAAGSRGRGPPARGRARRRARRRGAGSTRAPASA